MSENYNCFICETPRLSGTTPVTIRHQRDPDEFEARMGVAIFGATNHRKRMSIPFYFCFDVESIGLHGEAFAVGWVVVNRDGDMCFEGLLAVDPAKAVGDDSDRVWVNEHVPPIEANCKSYDFFREEFWRMWLNWKEKGAVMVADCAWPVEANFLRQCILYDTEARRFQGPYPLHDLASIRLAKGEDPTGDYERIAGEFPRHNPLCDARQTARHLIQLLKR